jgi:hypothetical protein
MELSILLKKLAIFYYIRTKLAIKENKRIWIEIEFLCTK